MSVLQTLDFKSNCKGLYYNGTFVFDQLQEVIDQHSLAWKHSPLLDDENFQYLYLFLRGEDISAFTKDPEIYALYRKKMEAHQRAAITAKVDLSGECFFDLVPESHLKKWFEIRSSALQRISTIFSKQNDYDILHKIHVLVTNIAQQNLTFGTKTGKVLYNIFGSATGRLTTTRASVPILTLKKEQRSLLRPQNDAFVELDLNAAEVRMLMALNG